jgi:hypothetical protein
VSLKKAEEEAVARKEAEEEAALKKQAEDAQVVLSSLALLVQKCKY